LGNQGRVEKLATGKTETEKMTGTKNTMKGERVTTTKINDSTQRLKITKDTFTVGTWNVQTLWAPGKLELLRNEMKRFRFDVVGISEVRWTGKGETPRGDFIWSGESTTHTKGVGLLLSAKARKSLIGYNPISSRLISARFNATPFKITIIHAYAPTSASSEDEIEIFYDKIEKTLAQTAKKDIVIIAGDWNAKIGRETTTGNW
jgi:exonuclease III